ncbi:hypothetical protein NKJ54_17370 [Mesorhizobium sp. M0098]
MERGRSSGVFRHAADTLEMEAKRSERLADMIEAEILGEQLMELDV